MTVTTLRAMRVIRYVVAGQHAELVSDRTAKRHRMMTVDDAGDVTVRLSANGIVLVAMSAAELHLIAREQRREMRRRRIARLWRRR